MGGGGGWRFGARKIGQKFPAVWRFRSNYFIHLAIFCFDGSSDGSHHAKIYPCLGGGGGNFCRWGRGIVSVIFWAIRDVHKDDSLAHYAKACTDITFKFPFGESELQVMGLGVYSAAAYENRKY